MLDFPISFFDNQANNQPTSNLRSRRTRKGEEIGYSYDALNRLTVKTPPAGYNLPATTYNYDVASRLTSVIANPTQGGEAISYAYDSLNRVTQVTTGTQTVGYEYDLLGNRTRLTYPDSTLVTYTYDQLNRLTAVKDQGGNSIASYKSRVRTRQPYEINRFTN